MPMKIGTIDDIQSRANAALACVLERNGDGIVWLLLKSVDSIADRSVFVGFGEKKITIRAIPTSISMTEINPSIYGIDL